MGEPDTKSILVVDDDADIRHSLTEILVDEGYDALTAGNGREALSMIRANHLPSLIVLDLTMPIMDGYEATRRIRANPDMTTIPIIAVTSYALAGDEAKALAAGCNAYVTKPFSPRALLAKVREYLA